MDNRKFRHFLLLGPLCRHVTRERGHASSHSMCHCTQLNLRNRLISNLSIFEIHCQLVPPINWVPLSPQTMSLNASIMIRPCPPPSSRYFGKIGIKPRKMTQYYLHFFKNFSPAVNSFVTFLLG